MPRIIFFDHVLKDLKNRCEIIKIDEITNGFDISIEKLSASIDLVQRKSYEICSLDEYFF